MVSEGATAPDFALPGTSGTGIEEFCLEDYSDDIVVLAFYSFDFSETCTGMVCSLRDTGMLTLNDTQVLGISHDSAFAHQEYIKEFELPFPLLCDSTGKVADKYGVLAEEWFGHENVPKRAAFIIQDGTIEYADIAENPYEAPDLRELNERVLELRE